MPERVQKRFSYRRCHFNKKGIYLQERLAAALKSASKARSRTEPLSSDAGAARRLINYYDSGVALCGELIIFEPGRSREIVGEDENSAYFPLSALSPPVDKNGKHQQFVDAILYFCVIENDLAVCESRGLRVVNLERHLDWLLRSQTDAVTKDTLFAFEQEFLKSTAKRISDTGVKAIKLSRPLFDGFEPEQKSGTTNILLRPIGIGLETLKTFLGSSAKPLDQIRLDTLLDRELIDVSVEIRVRGRNNRSGVEAATKVLQLAHIDPSSDDDGPRVELELADKTTVKHGEMMPHQVVSVSAHNGIPDRSELWEKMRDWLSDLVT